MLEDPFEYIGEKVVKKTLSSRGAIRSFKIKIMNNGEGLERLFRKAWWSLDRDPLRPSTAEDVR